MDTLISKCDGENVVLQVDFSENATIASQLRPSQHTGAMVRQPISQCMLGSRKMKMEVLSLCQMI